MAFAVFQANPIAASVTAGTGSERAELRRLVQPGGFCVFDRGYADDDLFQDLHDQACSFVGRVQEDATDKVLRKRPLAATDRAAGGVRDLEPRRLGTPEVLILVTNRVDLDAELIAVAYRCRWTVEWFFRWLTRCAGRTRRHTVFTPRYCVARPPDSAIHRPNGAE